MKGVPATFRKIKITMETEFGSGFQKDFFLDALYMSLNAIIMYMVNRHKKTRINMKVEYEK